MARGISQMGESENVYSEGSWRF